MATYNIPRSGVEALMPEEYQREIIQNVPQSSAVMSLGTRAPNMTRAQRRIPVLSSLPTAYFTNPGPTNDKDFLGWKQTSRAMWENKFIDAEELNVIVPIAESVLDDADYDIWSNIKPLLLEAFGLAFDQAVFYGYNAPYVWPVNLVAAAVAAGHNVTLPDGSTKDWYDAILGEDGLIAKVEEDGFMPNGYVAAMIMRSKLRALRDTSKQPIFKSLSKEGMQGSTNYELDGSPIIFPQNGSIVPSRSLIIAGDWKQLIYAIRQDITWKVLSEAVIQDPITKEIVYNLAQQNMVALRACMRLGWQVPNPINRLNTDEDTRYPFSVIQGGGS
jgi:HK97 family phage major capsid protein